jgi:uncharacterized membrane protein YhaH (DUF805 family)|tara:strand:+ start:496 stop:1008 length:513 start_codon:yes stop_codon:yes gene_type:complete
MDQAKVQGLQDLLLKFEGRIGPNSLWQGAIVILIVMVLLQLLGFLLGFLGMIFYLLTIALIYPLFCIYAKRFHDAGKPAIWTLAVLAGMIVAYMILNTLMAPFYMSNAVAAANSGAVYTMTFTALLVGWIITAVVHLGAAFVVNQVLKSDPAPNAYGPPPVDAASPNPLG